MRDWPWLQTKLALRTQYARVMRATTVFNSAVDVMRYVRDSGTSIARSLMRRRSGGLLERRQMRGDGDDLGAVVGASGLV